MTIKKKADRDDSEAKNIENSSEQKADAAVQYVSPSAASKTKSSDKKIDETIVNNAESSKNSKSEGESNAKSDANTGETHQSSGTTGSAEPNQSPFNASANESAYGKHPYENHHNARDYASKVFGWLRDLGLQRSERRVLGGVCSGIAKRMGWSVAAVRVFAVLAALLPGFGFMLYATLWAILPDERDGSIPLEEVINGRFSVDVVPAVIFMVIGLLYSFVGTPINTIIELIFVVLALIVLMNLTGGKLSNLENDIRQEVDKKHKERAAYNTYLETENYTFASTSPNSAHYSEQSAQSNFQADTTQQNSLTDALIGNSAKMADAVTTTVNAKLSEKERKYREKYDGEYYQKKYAQKEAAWAYREANRRPRAPRGIVALLWGIGFFMLGIATWFDYSVFPGHFSTIFSLLVGGYTMLVSLIMIIIGAKGYRSAGVGFLVGCSIFASIMTIAINDNDNELISKCISVKSFDYSNPNRSDFKIIRDECFSKNLRFQFFEEDGTGVIYKSGETQTNPTENGSYDYSQDSSAPFDWREITPYSQDTDPEDPLVYYNTKEGYRETYDPRTDTVTTLDDETSPGSFKYKKNKDGSWGYIKIIERDK